LAVFDIGLFAQPAIRGGQYYIAMDIFGAGHVLKRVIKHSLKMPKAVP